MTDKEVMQMALEALQVMKAGQHEEEKAYMDKAIEALRTALAQPEQDDEAYGYAKYLAECIWKKHYKEESPHWRPSDNTLSVLTQIDNMTCGLEKAQPDTTSDSATHSADSAESFCKQELHNLMSVAGRMALELECLLLDTENLSVVSKWWDTGMEALQAYRHYVWSVTHGKDGENFCDTHCVHTDHHPNCKLAQPEQIVANKSNCGHKTYKPLCQMCRSTKQPEQEPDNWWDDKEYVKNRFGNGAKVVNVRRGLPKDAFKHTISEPVKERISEPVENLEPVAWFHIHNGIYQQVDKRYKNEADVFPLYAAPPKREWAGLTEEEKAEIFQSDWNVSYEMIDMAEAKLKEKNT